MILRRAYETCVLGADGWIEIAGDYAATAEGRERLTAQAITATLADEATVAAALRRALVRGDNLRVAREDAARAALPRRPRALQESDISRVTATFGVADAQVQRDHAISHTLAALARMPGAHDLVFFGGTALSRTYLPSLRLSEDIDLITTADRRVMAARIETTLPRSLQRSLGALRWDTGPTAVRAADPAVLRTATGATIRVQLLGADGYPRWPATRQRLVQRYRDAQTAELVTFTARGFAASKLDAWLDRHAPRDLYDMWGLAQAGHIDGAAAAMFQRLGTTTGAPAPWMFDADSCPDDDSWLAALSHQGQVRITAAEALHEVREAWRSAAGA